MPSTVIGQIDYDPETQLMFVRFVPNGRRYVYEDVPAAVVEAFRRSTAKGIYFNNHIRDKFVSELVDPGSAG